MLILTRRINEQLMIGDDVVVTLLGVNGNQARIGISAPKGMRIDRKEIRERKDASMSPPIQKDSTLRLSRS